MPGTKHTHQTEHTHQDDKHGKTGHDDIHGINSKQKEVKHSDDGTHEAKRRWYVIHAYSGFEKMVLRTLKERIAQSSLVDQFGHILLPTEEVMDVKNGKKSISERKFFPGYLFIEMEMNEETWHLVKSTPKITGFIGGIGNKPHPLPKKEIDRIRARIEEGSERPKPKVVFEVGQAVRVTEGPFTDFNGTVEKIGYERSKIRVNVEIFGRVTPVELDFDQVEKV